MSINLMIYCSSSQWPNEFTMWQTHCWYCSWAVGNNEAFVRDTGHCVCQ